MKRKNYILLYMLMVFGSMLYGQSGISLYHLNHHTIQGSNFNPAFMPDGKFFMNIAGVGIDYNNRYSYNDIITSVKNGKDSLNWNGIADHSKTKNYIGTEVDISTIYLGLRANSTTGFSLFIRERMGARLFLPGDLVNFAINGNASFVGKNLDIGKTAIDARYYREYGLGIWKSIPNQGINIGVRIKYLNGMASIISDPKFDGSVVIGEQGFNFDLNNSQVNTSGLNYLSDDKKAVSHLISNANRGMGIDFGAHWKINEYVSAAVSVNDLGFINWKVDPDNYVLKDTTFQFKGIQNFRADFNIKDVIQDSLLNRFQDTVTHHSYYTGLNTSAFGSVMFQPNDNDLITGTIASSIVQGHYRMMYAVGYTRKVGNILHVSANIIRKPQQGFDIGLAYALNLGPLQFYMASDQLIKVWNVPNASAFDLRFGLNFVFGRQKIIKDDRSDLIHPSAYGKKAHIEKSDGIYWIIKRQKPRPIYEKSEFQEQH